MEINLIDIIIKDSTKEINQDIISYLEKNKEICSQYIETNSKYKDKIICLDYLYKTIKSNLFNEILSILRKKENI